MESTQKYEELNNDWEPQYTELFKDIIVTENFRIKNMKIFNNLNIQAVAYIYFLSFI